MWRRADTKLLIWYEFIFKNLLCSFTNRICNLDLNHNHLVTMTSVIMYIVGHVLSNQLVPHYQHRHETLIFQLSINKLIKNLWILHNYVTVYFIIYLSLSISRSHIIYIVDLIQKWAKCILCLILKRAKWTQNTC